MLLSPTFKCGHLRGNLRAVSNRGKDTGAIATLRSLLVPASNILKLASACFQNETKADNVQVNASSELKVQVEINRLNPYPM
eukprot:scaffold39385_cov24-Tisochrysis_lutea.AAC.4